MVDLPDKKLFLKRREESRRLLDILMSEDNYERKYKLLDAAYEKLLGVSVWIVREKLWLTVHFVDPG